MATNVSFTGHIQGSSDINGPINPKDIQAVLNGLGADDTVGAKVPPAAVDFPIVLPTMTSQSLVVIKSDQAITFKRNLETVVHGTGPNGAHIYVSQGASLSPIIDQILVSNPSPTLAAVVSVFAAG